MPLSTVSAVLQREGLGKRSRLEPPEPVNRYERRAPGRARPHRRQEARPDRRARPRASPATGASAPAAHASTPPDARRGMAGWEFVHVAIDDYSRLAYAEVLADEKRHTAIGFLRARARVLRRPRHHRRAGDDRQRLGLPSATRTASPATSSASATCAPGPTGPAPTAKPNASSRPSPAAGPTAAPTDQAPNAPQRSTPGSTTTTSPDHTAASATSHPAHD